jgi:hypothetical protein
LLFTAVALHLNRLLKSVAARWGVCGQRFRVAATQLAVVAGSAECDGRARLMDDQRQINQLELAWGEMRGVKPRSSSRQGLNCLRRSAGPKTRPLANRRWKKSASGKTASGHGNESRVRGEVLAWSVVRCILSARQKAHNGNSGFIVPDWLGRGKSLDFRLGRSADSFNLEEFLRVGLRDIGIGYDRWDGWGGIEE